MQVNMYLIYASHTYLLIHLWITSSPITYIFSYAMPCFKLARQIRNQHACSIMFIFYCVLSTQWKGHMIYRVLNSDNISKYLLLLWFYLLSMKHGLSWEGAAPESDAGCSVRHGCPRVYAALTIFFFFFFFHGFASTRLDSHQLGFCSRRLGQNQAESGHIGWRPKWPWIMLEQLKPGFEWGLNLSFLNFILKICCFFCVYCLLLSLFCESRHSNVFFKNILIVKMYRKYK